jgi:(2Fe-2S) ferredoxin
MKIEHHIFVCTNTKGKGKHRCSEVKGWELIDAFNTSLKAKGLNKSVKVQHTCCLHQCSHGPTLCIYPKGIFYGKVKPADVQKLVKKHIVKGKKVKKLAI